PAHHAVPDRVLSRAAGLDRAARRVVPVDPRPEPEGPAVPDAAADGRVHLPHDPLADGAQRHGPGAAAHHDDHAGGAVGHVPVGARRAQPVLAGLEPLLAGATGADHAHPDRPRARPRGRVPEGAATVKDAIFSGPDVAAALQAAGRALGLPPEQLRYVVLEAGTPGRLGLQAQPARIAVMMDAGPAGEAAAGPEEEAAREVAGALP